MADLIQKTDSLNDGRVKLNEAIKDADTAKGTAKGADSKASQALSKSENTQTQLDQIVINGDSSVEAAQARVDAGGKPHTTLKARLDSEQNFVTSQLAEKANQNYVTTELTETKNLARNSTVTKERIPNNEIPSSKLATTNQVDRIKLVNLHEEVLQAMAGSTPINSVPGDGTVTTEKLAPQIRDNFLSMIAAFTAEGENWEVE